MDEVYRAKPGPCQPRWFGPQFPREDAHPPDPRVALAAPCNVPPPPRGRGSRIPVTPEEGTWFKELAGEETVK